MKRGAWIAFVASRWFRSGRDSGPSLAPATAGIAVGVAALLCVIGVMNGLQMGFIEAVLDLDSYHVRVPSSQAGVDEVLSAIPGALAAMPFVDVRTVAMNSRGKTVPVRVKVVPDDAPLLDPVFSARLELRAGQFGGGLLVGSELARALDIRVGDTVSVLSVSADEEEGVDADVLEMGIAGIFHSGYYEFDAALAFAPQANAQSLGDGEDPIIGVRLDDRYGDDEALVRLEAAGIRGAESWRRYNRAFFGALRMEKSVMMMLIGLIFLVVGVNIFHSMRKTVYGRVDDIATLKALGAGTSSLRRVFLLDGLAAGGGGALVGLMLGLLVSMNVNEVFSAVEALAEYVYRLSGGSGSGFEFFSPDFFYIGEVPVRLLFGETLFIATAGALSALAAAWAASSRVSRILPSEVLRNE
ncbi:MAG: ABC transporter permease [Spirochaetales bacterium]|nr:ABC transporter permease [Spirochaetales bacterium]